MVYVDKLLRVLRHKSWKYVEACHMFADTEDELVQFAKKIGLKPEWIQHGRTRKFTHFDLTKNKRALAVASGAVEVDGKFVIQFLRGKNAH